MALTATIYHFTIRLTDVDRGVYGGRSSSRWRSIRRRPREYLVTRVLAYCPEYAEGDRLLARAVESLTEPPIARYAISPAALRRPWIEVSSPDAARLHKASKAAPRSGGCIRTRIPLCSCCARWTASRITGAETLGLYRSGAI
jgi:uncharacterized protein YaeQ